jgi:hypothetical protein
MVGSRIPPDPRIIKGIRQMTPSEMEEQIKNLNVWAEEVAQILPRLATKEDLKAYATKEDLRDAVAKLATKEDLKAYATKEDLKATKEELKAGLDDAKRYTENLILVTRREIRQVDQKVDALGRQLEGVAGDVKNIAEQVTILTTRKNRRGPT